MLTLLLILAQLHISHYERLHMPAGHEWEQSKKEPLICKGDFVMPESGYTIHYADLKKCTTARPTQALPKGTLFRKPPANYRNVPVAPELWDKEFAPTVDKPAYYDVDEGPDHITYKSKLGTHWWYVIIIAVPKEIK